MNDELAWSLLLTSGVSFVIFGWVMLDLLLDYARSIKEHDHDFRVIFNIEHGLVVISALTVIAGANVLIGTTFIEQDHTDDPALILGAIVVRGALLVTAIYILIRPPRPR